MQLMTSNPQSLADASAGELVSRMSQDLSTLIRDELRLAQAETSAKAKKMGLGIGLFGGAGVITLFGVGALVAAAILGLSLVVDPWLAALIVGGALLVIAAVAALLGKRDVSAAAPPVPTEAVAGLKSDVNTLREGVRR
jgi:ABC-type multidrug transport system fused ATPase/permease subunit